MNRRLPPNLYQRQYKTRGGYTVTRYYACFRDWAGKRRAIPLGEDFTEAKNKLRELKIQNGQHFNFDKAVRIDGKLFAWIDKFLAIKADKRSADRDKKTATYLKAFFGDPPLGEISTTKMLEYRNSRPVSVASVNRELAMLRSVLNMAHHDGALANVPRVPMEAEHNERVRTASEKEYRAILKAVEPKVRDCIEILWETGFRVGEVLKLTPANLDYRNRGVNVAGIRQKGGLKRVLPMSARAWQILALRAKGRPRDARLFDFTRHVVHWHFVSACQAAKISGLWVHDLRATFATEKERQGWPRKLIREYTGHRTEYAFNRYSRPTVDDLRAFIGLKDQRIINRHPSRIRKHAVTY